MNLFSKTKSDEHTGRKNPKRTFLCKLFYLFFPFFVALVFYFIADPFMVLRSYKSYAHSRAFLNEAYVGWQTYLNNRDSLRYNSFIMGNSCTMAFKSAEWAKYIQDARILRFFDNMETLGGVAVKIKALDESGAEIKNILLALDVESFANDLPQDGYIHAFSPETSGISELKFQLSFLRSFFFPDFLVPFTDYGLFHTYRSYMCGLIPDTDCIRKPFTNDAVNPHDKEIAREGKQYWINKPYFFPPRDSVEKVSPALIHNRQLERLFEIRDLCRKHRADLRIVVNPDYSQVRLHPEDLRLLQLLFGKQHVFDFSGINEYTADICNYYEKGHYTDVLGSVLLKQVYASPDGRMAAIRTSK